MTPPTGILIVDKPVGPTSHDVVDRVRKASGIRRVGHAGTLDPFASGVLLLLLGSATRLSEYFLKMGKSYTATVRLGVETETHDPEGEVTREDSGWREVTEEEIRRALDGFRGRVLQVPPAYSAKKVRGEAAHRRIRRGEEVELSPVPVEIHELELLETNLPDVRLALRCSSGTYVRALARDLGKSLGVGGYLTALRRTRIGPFDLDSTLSLDSLQDQTDVRAGLISAAQALSHLPVVSVGASEAVLIRQGQFLQLTEKEVPEETPICVLLDGELLAIAAREGDRLRPRKVFVHG
jgi:tRNA pseudouridine55 synthase